MKIFFYVSTIFALILATKGTNNARLDTIPEESNDDSSPGSKPKDVLNSHSDTKLKNAPNSPKNPSSESTENLPKSQNSIFKNRQLNPSVKNLDEVYVPPRTAHSDKDFMSSPLYSNENIDANFQPDLAKTLKTIFPPIIDTEINNSPISRDFIYQTPNVNENPSNRGSVGSGTGHPVISQEKNPKKKFCSCQYFIKIICKLLWYCFYDENNKKCLKKK